MLFFVLTNRKIIFIHLQWFCGENKKLESGSRVESNLTWCDAVTKKLAATHKPFWGSDTRRR